MTDQVKLRLVESYSTLLPERKIILLSVLALELTIIARGTYPSEEEEFERDNFEKLMCFNEIQHTLMGQLCKMINNDVTRYPDDVFLQMLLEKASDGYCERDLITTVKGSFEHIRFSN